MELSTAHILADATSAFYQANAESFSLTRQTAWPGWQRVMEDAGVESRKRLRVLDVACGNLRFESYLARTWPKIDFGFHAMDSCEALLPENMPHVSFTRMDIVNALLDEGGGASLEPSLAFREPRSEGFDLTVCFGFMHHVPTFPARSLLLKSLVTSLAPNGIAAVSLWKFMDSAKLAAKASAATKEALDDLGLSQSDLDQNDYLLGWQGSHGPWRYCHHFCDDEIDQLIDVADAHVVDRFRADGRTGALNEYLVLQRKENRG